MIYICSDSNDFIHTFLILTCPSAYCMSKYCNTLQYTRCNTSLQQNPIIFAALVVMHLTELLSVNWIGIGLMWAFLVKMTWSLRDPNWPIHIWLQWTIHLVAMNLCTCNNCVLPENLPHDILRICFPSYCPALLIQWTCVMITLLSITCCSFEWKPLWEIHTITEERRKWRRRKPISAVS